MAIELLDYGKDRLFTSEDLDKVFRCDLSNQLFNKEHKIDYLIEQVDNLNREICALRHIIKTFIGNHIIIKGKVVDINELLYTNK